MSDFSLVQGDRILCLACKEQGKIFYAKRITANHLIGKHKNLFPDRKIALQEYKISGYRNPGSLGGKSHRLVVRLAGKRLPGYKGRPFYTLRSARSYIVEKCLK